jgi:hypothetical protein
VLDNLSTHTGGVLYETFPASKTHSVLQCLELHYTPKHAKWLKMVEIEIGVLRGQCLDRRIGERSSLPRSKLACRGATLPAHASMEVRHSEGTEQAGQRLIPKPPKSRNHCAGVLIQHVAKAHSLGREIFIIYAVGGEQM